MNIPILSVYTKWLHTMYPAGTVERLPEVREDGSTRVQGLFVVGDLKGIPLLKFSSDSGARAVEEILGADWFRKARSNRASATELVIIGAGVAGISAALRAKKLGINFRIIEASGTFSTIVNFPKGKPIYTYPRSFQPDSELMTTGAVKESLLDELMEQVRASDIKVEEGIAAECVTRAGGVLSVKVREGEPISSLAVIVAIGRSGSHRRLSAAGETLDKVSNRLHDPGDYAGRKVMVVGGGDSALEAAIALAHAGVRVLISYRGRELARPKPENVEAVAALVKRPGGGIDLRLGTEVVRIDADTVTLRDVPTGREESLPNDYVFTMLGREAPLEFFRKSGVPIRGEWNFSRAAAFGAFLLFCVFLYLWKAGSGPVDEVFRDRLWFPNNLYVGDGTGWFEQLSTGLKAKIEDPKSFIGTLSFSMANPSFYYTLAYSVCVVVFGFARIRRRRTPYVTAQTICLMLIQVVPLFLLPEVILPWAGANGAFDSGIMKTVADGLFPMQEWGREYWRAYGLILAWPLFIYNIFTEQPLIWWLVIGFVQTFVLIPGLIYFWGKGAYCGWICSCGALAETLGDTHRQKMPHGPFWNRLNMTGQVILWLAFAALVVRVYTWVRPNDAVSMWFNALVFGSYQDAAGESRHNYISYKWVVDTLLAGIIGVGFYFWYSGRVWCRFACPLAALMHIYAKWSRFRIISDKKKCISCNVCTSVCHQGIDVMNFANKGLHMEDPECVRCSACVQSCPTGVLQFGQVNGKGEVIELDRLAASPVLIREGRE